MILLKYEIRVRYFNWLMTTAIGGRFREATYDKLLIRLSNTPFRYTIERDCNRAEDGIDLRWRFANLESNAYLNADTIMDNLSGACSVLEMMIALAIRCEETIMDDPSYGDRSLQWFWGMIVSLGLGSMTDDLYDDDYVTYILDRFMDRKYEPNGKGGLFTIRGCDRDLRTVEIWYQLCWYLDSIT